MRHLVVVLATALLFQAALGQSLPAKIGVGDVLKLTVVGFDEFSGDLTVSSDGSVSSAPVGRIEVAGLTLEEAQQGFRDRLTKYIKSPLAFLSFISQANAYIFVAGAVTTNGRVPYTPALDIRSVFAGMNLGGDPDGLYCTVYRGGKQIQKFELMPTLKGESDGWTGPLEPGDLLVLAPRAMIRVWMVGRVRMPGERSVPSGSTLSQAIAQAGGFESSEDPLVRLSITVRRGTASHQFIGHLDGKAAEFVLQSGDTVTVEAPRFVNVFVTGSVLAPRRVRLEEGDDLFSAIIDAGGLNAAGTLRGVLVFRKGQVYSIDLTKRLEGTSEYEPWPLEEDDIVIVPRNEQFIYVLGAIVRPGRYMIPDSEEFNATSALSLAGGISAKGTHRRVILGRPDSSGVFQTRRFNIDEFLKDGLESGNPVLMPGDVLFFGQPEGVSLASVSRMLSSALLLEALFGN